MPIPHGRYGALLSIVSLAALALLLLAGPAFAAAPDETYYVPDVAAQFGQLTDRADALGWGIGDSPDPSTCYHYQGMARSTGKGTPYLFVTKSGNQPPLPCLVWCGNTPCTEVGDGPANLLVVKMASRDTTGERLRSNRLVHHTETSDSHPDPADVVVKTITFDGNDGWPYYGHAGGVQVAGDVLVVPLEHPYSGDQGFNEVLFVDISNPEDPLPLSSLPIAIDDDFTAGAVGIARQSNGTYLLLVTGKDNIKVQIYESYHNTPSDPGIHCEGAGLHDTCLAWALHDTWRPAAEPVDPPCYTIPPNSVYPNGFSWGWPDGGFFDYAHQSLNFVREGGPDGQLYLIGARNDNALPFLGDDMLDLYRVSWDGANFGLGCVAQRHLHSTASLDGALLFHSELADFAAATGTYVSPSGDLIFYGTQHENDGPGGSVNMGEWRERDMVRPYSSSYDPTAVAGGPYVVPEGSSVTLNGSGAPPATRAWIELYNDDHYEDRYVVIDYDDRFKDDFDNFTYLDDGAFETGFREAAGSLRWYAPTGCTIQLSGFRTVFTGTGFDTIHVERTLDGLDEVGAMSDLDDFANQAPGGGSLDDAIWSVRFEGDCDAYYTAALSTDWDMNRDGTFETPGPAASFSAALLDGPSSASVTLQVQHPTDLRTSWATAEIAISNVPPTLSNVAVTDTLGRPIDAVDRPALLGLPLTLGANFDDPGQPDTHTASITWGDGVTSAQGDLDLFTPATGPGVGRVQEAHRYAAKGTYPVTLNVIDDDGGVTAAPLNVRVVDAADLLGEIAGDIEQSIAGITNASALRQLTAALRAIIGSQGGGASNGALDQLETDNLNAAMVKIRDAVRALQQAETITGLNFHEQEGSLALVALSIASTAVQAATVIATPPTATQTRTLADANAALARGNARLAVSDFVGAVDEFQAAVQKVTGTLTKK